MFSQHILTNSISVNKFPESAASVPGIISPQPPSNAHHRDVIAILPTNPLNVSMPTPGGKAAVSREVLVIHHLWSGTHTLAAACAKHNTSSQLLSQH